MSCKEAFALCDNLKSIKIPSSVKSIGVRAFSGTKWLSNQQKKNSLVIVNNMLIDGSTAKGKVTIPNSVKSIGNDAFYGCKNLSSVTISKGVTSIGDYAFQECTNLTSITIPNSVKSIGDNAFEGCNRLVIYGKKGSKAESYAKENNIKFIIK